MDFEVLTSGGQGTLRVNGDPSGSREVEVMGLQHVLTVGGNTPPGSPATNDRHLIGAAPTGAWAGHALAFTRRTSAGAWEFEDPSATVSRGWAFFCVADSKTYQWTGAAYAVLEPLGSQLAPIAALTSAADRLPYYTGSGTAALATFTAAGRALVDDADAAAQRTTLGLTIGTNVQAQDAQLEAIAGLNPSADQFAYFTSSTAAALTTVTSFARTLLDDVDAATMRTTLGLSIGGSVQPYDIELAAIAGLTSAADQLPYFTGSGTASLATFTSAARSLLDDVDAATMRATLGLTIGTSVQAYDAELAAIAGLTSAADQVPYFTGSGTAALMTVTNIGRALLDDTSFFQMKTTLGLTIGSDVQAYHSNLQALSAVVAGADRLPYFNGTSTATHTAFTAAGRALIDDADATAQRVTLGLVIGTDVQAYDAQLAAIAALAPAADQVPYFTALTTASLMTVTAAGRALLDDVDAAAMRATLGIAVGSDVQAYDAELAAIAGLSSAADQAPLFTGVGTATTYTVTSAARTLLDDTTVGAMRTTLGVAVGSDVQAYDAELAAIAGLTSAADRLPYFTGLGTASLATFSAAARTLVDDATVSDMRTTLGLVIGTNVQAYDSELAALAGLTSAADQAPYFTGSGTAALMNVTAAARTLLDDVTVSDMRTTLGLAIGSNVQAYDAELAALAGVTSAANVVPYFTGSGTANTTAFTPGGRAVVGLTGVADTVPYYTSSSAVSGASLTAAGRALIDDADAAAQRTTLGLVIGTNVQAYDAELAAIAGLTSAADTAPYFTGSGTAALMSVTAAARTLLDDTTVSAMRTTLGLAIGTDVQASNANLSAIAGLASASDYSLYFTGSGTASLMQVTALSRTLLAYGTASNWRAELGVTQSVKTSVSAAFGTVAAGPGSSHFDIALTGITANDAVVVSPRADLPNRITIKHVRCATTNTLRVSLYNDDSNTVIVGTVTLDVAYMR